MKLTKKQQKDIELLIFYGLHMTAEKGFDFGKTSKVLTNALIEFAAVDFDKARLPDKGV